MNKRELGQLIDKYLQGDASAEEEQLLVELFESFQSGSEWDEELLGARQQLEDKMLQRLQQTINDPNAGKTDNLISLIAYIRTAAAVVLLTVLSVALYHYVNKPAAQHLITKNKTAVKHDVEPGSNKAILTLNDGSKLVLNAAKNGVIVKKGNISVKKEKDGKLVYVVGKGKATADAGITYNTISTPIGGQYQVVLPDGTKVWLDAESSLKFPTAFTGDKRNVELTGEGYFEVAKNAAKPFYVKVNNVQVKVLGTHFNINAYPTEAAIKTTLLEGSVQLTSGTSVNFLKPGQQGVVNSSGIIKVFDVDTEQAVAWKNGFFEFNRSDIQDIMNQLSRWYDTKVTYEGKIPDDEFVGKIERSSKLSHVLHILELSHVHFRIEDKNIIVTP